MGENPYESSTTSGELGRRSRNAYFIASVTVVMFWIVSAAILYSFALLIVEADEVWLQVSPDTFASTSISSATRALAILVAVSLLVVNGFVLLVRRRH